MIMRRARSNRRLLLHFVLPRAMFGGSLDELFGNGIASTLLADDDAFLTS
jgi:hypothetical protein